MNLTFNRAKLRAFAGKTITRSQRRAIRPMKPSNRAAVVRAAAKVFQPVGTKL